MQLFMIGLKRMGGNVLQPLVGRGHEPGYNRSEESWPRATAS